MKRIVSANGYRKEKSNTQVVLALKDTKPRTVVDVRIRQGLKKIKLKVDQEFLHDCTISLRTS